MHGVYCAPACGGARGEARELFQALATVNPDQRTLLLEDAVKRAGIEPKNCETLQDYQ